MKLDRLFGLIGLILSLIGISFNVETSVKYYKTLSHDKDLPYFFNEAFLIFSAYAYSCHFLLLGSSLTILFSSRKRYFAYWIANAMAYLPFLVVPIFWNLPHYGSGIAAATGISFAGLIPVCLTTIAFWLPVLIPRLHQARLNTLD